VWIISCAHMHGTGTLLPSREKVGARQRGRMRGSCPGLLPTLIRPSGTFCRQGRRRVVPCGKHFAPNPHPGEPPQGGVSKGGKGRPEFQTTRMTAQRMNAASPIPMATSSGVGLRPASPPGACRSGAPDLTPPPRSMEADTFRKRDLSRCRRASAPSALSAFLGPGKRGIAILAPMEKLAVREPCRKRLTRRQAAVAAPSVRRISAAGLNCPTTPAAPRSARGQGDVRGR